MLIYADEKDIDAHVLSALNKRSIVFDGRVIVESTYRTTDRDIYAAGPLAMFSRRFGPSQDFDIYNAQEVGDCLSETILGVLGIDEFAQFAETEEADRTVVSRNNPLAAALGYEQQQQDADEEADNNGPVKRPRVLPRYTHNTHRRVTLPTGHTFYCCQTVDYPEVASQCERLHSYSLDLINGGDGTKPVPIYPPVGERAHDVPIGANPFGPEPTSYISLALAPSGRIERLVYVGTDTRELAHLCSIVGTFESAFNLRYNFHATRDDEGRPALDMQRFLRMPQSRVQFHGSYRDVVASIFETLATHPTVAAAMAEVLEAIQYEEAMRAEQMGARGPASAAAATATDGEGASGTTDAGVDSVNATDGVTPGAVGSGAQAGAAIPTGPVYAPEDIRQRVLARLTADPAVRRIIELAMVKFLHGQKMFEPQLHYLPDVRAFV
jgi:hypothetical protein